MIITCMLLFSRNGYRKFLNRTLSKDITDTVKLVEPPIVANTGIQQYTWTLWYIVLNMSAIALKHWAELLLWWDSNMQSDGSVIWDREAAKDGETSALKSRGLTTTHATGAGVAFLVGERVRWSTPLQSRQSGEWEGIAVRVLCGWLLRTDSLALRVSDSIKVRVVINLVVSAVRRERIVVLQCSKFWKQWGQQFWTTCGGRGWYRGSPREQHGLWNGMESGQCLGRGETSETDAVTQQLWAFSYL